MQTKEEEIKQKFVDSINILSQKTKDKTHKEAESFLKTFEKAPESWVITASILKTPGLDKYVYLYASNVLKKKLQYDSFELPQDEYSNLAELILDFLAAYDDRAICSQLAISLSILYLRDYSRLGSIIEILTKTLCQDEKKAIQVLQILEMVAAVSIEDSIVIEKKRLLEYAKFLEEKILEGALLMINQISKTESVREQAKQNVILNLSCKKKIFLALQEWLLVCNTNTSALQFILNSDVFKLVIEGMNDFATSEEAGLCLRRLMKTTESADDWPELYEKIFAAISSYLENFKTALLKDEDHAIQYAKVFTYFAKKFSKNILQGDISTQLKDFLLMLMELTNLKEFDGFVELERFWYVLSNRFMSLDETSKTLKLKDLQPLYTELVSIATERLGLNESQLNAYELFEGKKKKKSTAEKKKDRENCKNLLRDCVHVIGHEGVIMKLDDMIVGLVSEIKVYPNKYSEIEIISKMEAIINALKTNLKDMNDTDNYYTPVLDDFLEAIFASNISKIKFHNTVNSMFAYAADFKNIKKEYLNLMFQYLIKDLENPKTRDMAGKALISLSSFFESFILEHYSEFIKIANSLENNEDLIICIANAVGSSDNVDQAEQGLALLSRPYFEDTIEKSLDKSFLENEIFQEAALQNLRRLAFIFEKIPQASDPTKKHMLDSIFKEVFPYILKLLKVYINLGQLTEDLCKMMKKIIKSLGLKFEPYLKEYFSVICENFGQNPICSYLYQAEIVVAIFAGVESCYEILTEIFNFFTKTTIQFFNEKHFDNDLSILEDYLGMVFRYTKYKPSIAFQIEYLELNLELAVKVFHYDDHRLKKANLLFVEIIFKYCFESPISDIEKLISAAIELKYGAIFLRNCILEYMNYPVEKERCYLLDIIFANFIRMKNKNLQWLEMILSSDVPENILTNEEKKEILLALNNIDVTSLNPRSFEDSEKNSEKIVYEKFLTTLILFEHRCRQIALRERT